MSDCIFCKIAQGEIPSEVVYETDKIMVFKDLNPIAPIHDLIIPKAHLRDLNDLAQAEQRAELMEEVLQATQALCKIYQTDSFNLINNCGQAAGQSVFHLHFHFISGVDLTKHMAAAAEIASQQG